MQTHREESNIAHWVSEYPRYVNLIRHPKNRWFFGAVIPPRNTKEDQIWTNLTKQMHAPEEYDRLTGYL